MAEVQSGAVSMDRCAYHVCIHFFYSCKVSWRTIIASSSIFILQPTEVKKYSQYYVNVDPDQDDKATEIKLLSFKRPHMRAFHCSWMGFFTAFFIWFAIAPLLPEIKETLKLTKQEVWTSNICSVAGTIFMRFINGPMWWVYHIITMHQKLSICFIQTCHLLFIFPFSI